MLGADTFQLDLRYPQLFPETPPSVIPRDGRRISGHQYGRGGELCLEFRPDTVLGPAFLTRMSWSEQVAAIKLIADQPIAERSVVRHNATGSSTKI